MCSTPHQRKPLVNQRIERSSTRPPQRTSLALVCKLVSLALNKARCRESNTCSTFVHVLYSTAMLFVQPHAARKAMHIYRLHRALKCRV
ncbi:hypothetical protein BU23DRAFT_12764 [Bimuria novae-zelandiae CBS 107.79]|uniref:Uncharacterized protein n=1 Tax=Bimuria novae-zelandiae CBS 107.79 TaxID=1447943 RepID=A0A6A5VK45_9PLEO|nr:hypothetical protein BU23DRAFT_12764 [Bimuria novae-zelandiae CBS 107.79]